MRALGPLAGALWRHASAAPWRRRQTGWLVGIALVAAVTGVIELLQPYARVSGLGALYLLAVLPVAVVWGTGVGLGVSLLSAAALAVFFLDVSNPDDAVALGVFVLAALVVSELSARSNREARAAKRLSDEQAALRRVATLVARGTAPEELFATVAEEIGGLLGTGLAAMARYDSDDTVTVVATWAADGGHGGTHPLVPGPWPLEGGDVATTVAATGRSVRIDSYEGVPGRIAAFVRDELGVVATVGSPIVVEGQLWGVLFIHSRNTHQPLPPDTESRLRGFTELVGTAIANAESRAGLARLAEEQAALHRVATLVAHGTPPDKLFAAVVEEIAQLLPVEFAAMGRYESDRTMTCVATSSLVGDEFPVGSRWPLEGTSVSTLVFETGRSARLDSYGDAAGPLAAAIRERGFGSAVGTPIIVEDRLWGVMTASSSIEQPMPADTESRLATFTELVATAIANTESRAALAVLADEQAALRRVATLVARGLPPTEIFAAVAEEVGRLVSIDGTRILRYEADGTATVIAGWSESVEVPPELEVGAHLPLDGESVATLVFRTGRPARIDDYANATGRRLADRMREAGVEIAAGAPIIVEGRLWGVVAVGSTSPEPLPPGIELRLAQFTELLATAIANAESRSELARSRTRIVAASDETRRRIERDLHDGAQQRLVTLGLMLRSAQAELPHNLERIQTEVSRVVQGLAAVLDDLRTISRGIHPAILSEGGLATALKILARRSPIPVALDVRVEGRLPESVEVAAYYVVSETLTNTAKHSQASVVYVHVAETDEVVHISVRDDGVGGADPKGGSGLVGLGDRVDALGGTLVVKSAKGTGTAVEVQLPLVREREAPDQVQDAPPPHATADPR